jgi:hypothetical protein
MIGVILSLICLLIIVILVKLILDQLAPGNTNIRLIVGLLLLLFLILWLFGGGGWGHVTNWSWPR